MLTDRDVKPDRFIFPRNDSSGATDFALGSIGPIW
jgi:hypothetical protein